LGPKNHDMSYRPTVDDDRAMGLPESVRCPMRVLVVVGEPLVALAVRDAVEEAGASVIGPARGEAEAVDLIRERRPDFAIIDVHLPGAADGIEVARRLDAGFGVRSVFLFGRSDQAALARVASGYSLGVLNKPFSRAGIKATLDLVARRLRGA